MKPLFSDIFCGKEKEFLGKKFAILCFCWSVYMYCFYIMTSFLQYTVGDIFTDTITIATAEGIGYIISAIIYVKKSGGK